MENKLYYLPAVSPPKLAVFKKKGLEETKFWKRTIHYPYMLVCAFYGMEYENFREFFDIGEDVFILLDSGGFQIVTQEKYIDPLKVLRWQMKTSKYGLILDVPPYHIQGDSEGAHFDSPNKEYFDKCLDATYENAKLALEKKDDDFNLYGVIQGETYEQIERWFDKLHSLEKEGKEFYGWALSPKPSNDANKIAMFAALLLTKGIHKPLHILQVSGTEAITICAYLQKVINQPVTIDSSSYGNSSRYGVVFDPMFLSRRLNFGNNQKIEPFRGKKWYCNCRACRNMNLEVGEEQFFNKIEIHNIQKIIDFTDYANMITEDENYFFKIYLPPHKKLYRACQIIRSVRDKGLESVKSQLTELCYVRYNLKQKNIFSF